MSSIEKEKKEYEMTKITVGRLRDALNLYPDSTELNITCEGRSLHFLRSKTRGKNYVCLELCEPTLE